MFVAAALLGGAIGWRAYTMLAAQRRAAHARETEQIRAALTEAQVRRARG